MIYSRCPKCKKNVYDREDNYCIEIDCGFSIRQTLQLPSGTWKSWAVQTYKGSGLFLYLTAPESAPDDVYVDVEKQLGTRHISEMGFDRMYYKEGKIPLEAFKEVCEERLIGRTPQSKKSLARVLSISTARLGQLVKKGKLNVKHSGTAWLPRSTMSMKIGFKAHRMVGIDKRTGQWPHVVKAEDI